MYACMKYDAIIVGGGIAGLTSAAFLAKNGYSVLLLEKEEHVGGLVTSFNVDGFLYDGGVRGIVDSGIVKPMLEQLDIELEFIKSIVTIGIEKEVVRIVDLDSLEDYRKMLVKLYPDSKNDIDEILLQMRKVMDYMDVLYGIENPLFKDLKNDKEYLMKTLFPWMFRFLVKSGKIKKFKKPIYEYLRKVTDNQSLMDIISQHFFQETPASFALSYFSLYLDYEYPVNGTYDLIKAMRDSLLYFGGIINTSTKISKINIDQKIVIDQNNKSYHYNQLIWAADQNQLYKAIDMESISDKSIRDGIIERKDLLQGKRGGDSIYSMFVAVDLDKDYFKKRSSGHMFYTPDKKGQSEVFVKLNDIRKSTSKDEILQWVNDLLELTTYEIAIPSLRNEKLAPKGKTGLIISTLMDYEFIKNINDLDFYEEFKEFTEKKILQVLSKSIYEGIEEKVIHRFSSTPLSIERFSGNHEGGITGWAFTNDENPSVNKMTKVKKSCETPIPDVLQAGQWTYSPSGLPISILTGKIAADQAEKVLSKG